MKKLQIYFILFLSTIAILCFNNNIFAQPASGSHSVSSGLTAQELAEITNYYYRDPQPAKLIFCLKAVLTQNELIANEQYFTPFVHFIAAAANNDETLLNELKKLKDMYSETQKDSIERIIKEAQNFKSPIPATPRDLVYLWVEFNATGKKEPVKKVIGIFDMPENSSNFLLLAAAELSLKSNAQMHQPVYEIIKEEAATANGTTKQVLDKILKDVEKNWQKYGFVKESVLDDKIARLDKMINDSPNDAANYLSRGLALANNLNYDKGLKDFLKALSLNPNLPTANNYVGFIYINKGKYNEAEPYLKKAIEQSPNFSKPYFNLARIYEHRNKLDSAIEQITKAMGFQPNFYEAYIMRAEMYYNKKEYAKSIADLKQAISINPSLKQQLENQIKIIQRMESQIEKI